MGKAGEMPRIFVCIRFFVQYGSRMYILDDHISLSGSYLLPFQINTQLFLLNFCTKWTLADILDVALLVPFWMTGSHFRSHFVAISGQYATLRSGVHFCQNGQAVGHCGSSDLRQKYK